MKPTTEEIIKFIIEALDAELESQEYMSKNDEDVAKNYDNHSEMTDKAKELLEDIKTKTDRIEQLESVMATVIDQMENSKRGKFDIFLNTLRTALQEKERTVTYYMLGERVCNAYYSGNIEAVLKEIEEGEDFGKFVFIEGVTPSGEFASAVDGWAEVLSIPEEDFNQLPETDE